jgi:hypothetical protein
VFCSGPGGSREFKLRHPVTGLEWPKGFQEVKEKQSRYRSGVAQRFQEVKVKQSRYRPGVAQRVPGN